MKVGTWVRLKRRERSGPQKARIAAELPALAEGAVRLTLPLGGFMLWNKSDLQRTVAPKGRRHVKV